MGICNCLFVPLIHRFDFCIKDECVAPSPLLSLHKYVAWVKKLVKWWLMLHPGEATWLDIAAQAFHFLTPWKKTNNVERSLHCLTVQTCLLSTQSSPSQVSRSPRGASKLLSTRHSPPQLSIGRWPLVGCKLACEWTHQIILWELSQQVMSMFVFPNIP